MHLLTHTDRQKMTKAPPKNMRVCKSMCTYIHTTMAGVAVANME